MLSRKKKRSVTSEDRPPAVAFVTETIKLPRIVTSDEENDDIFSLSPSDKGEFKHEEPEVVHESRSSPKIEQEDSESGTDSWNYLQQSGVNSLIAKPSVIKLNVGGFYFTTTRTTLCSRTSMLAAMFSGKYSPYQDEEGRYFIDRDGTHFRYILNYLRDGFVRLPDDLQTLQELMVESQYYQITGLINCICEAPRLSKNEYITIRYLPANTYDGWPIRIEGPLEEHIIYELNGGSMPPTRETPEVRNMYGQSATGWKVRGIFLTKIFNIIASYGWRLTTSNGSGGGKQRNFAEMYVFCRSKLLRRQRRNSKKKRRSESYSYSHLFSFLNTSSVDNDNIPNTIFVPEPNNSKNNTSKSKSPDSNLVDRQVRV